MSRTSPKTARIAIASTVGIASQLVSVAVALWSTPQLVHALGDAFYSLIGIVGSFVGYFAYLELGIGSAYVRALAIALAQRDRDRAQRLVATAHAIYCLVGCIGTVLMLGIGVPYLLRTVAEAHQRVEVVGSLAVTAAAFFASMFLSASRAIVISAQRTDLYSWVLMVAQPLIPIAQVVAAWHGGQLIALMLIQAIGGSAIDLVMLLLARRLHPELKLRPRVHRDVWRDLRGFSLFRFVAQLGQQGQGTGDRLLLGGLLPAASLAPYSIAASVAQRARSLGVAACAPFFPAAAEAFGLDGAGGLARVTAAFGRRLALLLAVGWASTSFLALPFLTMWVGPRYAAEGAPLLQWLVLGNAVLVLAIFLGQATDAAGAPRASAIAATLGVVVSVAVSVPLVHRFGPLGAAYGFLVGAVLHLGWLAASLVAIVGGRAAVATLSATIGWPTAVAFAAWSAMRLCPHGAGLAAALPPTLVGLSVALVTAVLTGTVRRQDVPPRLRRVLLRGAE